MGNDKAAGRRRRGDQMSTAPNDYRDVDGSNGAITIAPVFIEPDYPYSLQMNQQCDSDENCPQNCN